MAAAAILKITKIAISPQRFGLSLRNLVHWCRIGVLTSLIVKNIKFPNQRWRTAAILKTVKLPYFCNRLTDFYEIWHGNAYCPRTAHRPLKFRIFKNPRKAAAAIVKITTIAISPQRFDWSLQNLVWWGKWVSSGASTPYKRWSKCTMKK